MLRWLLVTVLAACGYSSAPPTAVSPDTRTAFCNSTCWNNSNCTGITACERCVGGTCTGQAQVAASEPDPDER